MRVFWFFFWSVVAFVVLYMQLCWVLFQVACRRFSGKLNPFKGFTARMNGLLDDYPELAKAGWEFSLAADYQDVAITSRDGLCLHGRILENPNARGVVVCCHGYRSDNSRDFMVSCPFYYGSGFTLLLMDQRACGESEGKYITFGVTESIDVADWCRFAAEKYPHLPILLGGISMGATSVMMASPHVPPAVKAIVADCGFVSPWEVLTAVIHSAGHYPARLILTGVNVWARLLAGFDMRASTKDALAQNTVPI